MDAKGQRRANPRPPWAGAGQARKLPPPQGRVDVHFTGDFFLSGKRNKLTNRD